MNASVGILWHIHSIRKQKVKEKKRRIIIASHLLDVRPERKFNDSKIADLWAVLFSCTHSRRKEIKQECPNRFPLEVILRVLNARKTEYFICTYSFAFILQKYRVKACIIHYLRLYRLVVYFYSYAFGGPLHPPSLVIYFGLLALLYHKTYFSNLIINLLLKPTDLYISFSSLCGFRLRQSLNPFRGTLYLLFLQRPSDIEYAIILHLERMLYSLHSSFERLLEIWIAHC